MELNNTAAIAPANLETVYGKKPWHGVAGLVAGAALTCAAAWLVSTFGFSGRFPVSLWPYLGPSPCDYIISLGVAGLCVLGPNFRVYGVRLTPEGLLVWEYFYWVMGRRRMVIPEEIGSVVLGNKKGKFTVSVRLRDGKEYPIPGKWVTLKDAQAIIDLCTSLYGVSAGVAITDQKVLEEAAAFAKAGRWLVCPFKHSRADGERLLFLDAEAQRMGEVALWKYWLRRARVGIADGPGDLAANGPRWLLRKLSYVSSSLQRRMRVAVTENGREAHAVEWSSSFLGDKFLQWTDAAGVCWSAVLTTEQSKTRTPFTMRFYRGLAEGVGKKAQRRQVEQSQGAPVLVALANGPAASFTVDVADEQAWPWVRIALACVWLCHRPSFSFAKR